MKQERRLLVRKTAEEVAASEAGNAVIPGTDPGSFGFTALDEGPEVLAIKAPAAGESIASATIAQWHKRDGEKVSRGDSRDS